MRHPRFGSDYTEKKLSALVDYLKAYLLIMNSNVRAQYLTKVYVDGFAGSGRRYAKEGQASDAFAEFVESDVEEFFKGSAHRCLELDPPFDEYIFVEKSPVYAKQLEELCAEFPKRNARVERADANKFLTKWCLGLERNDRGLVFLDPYGMQVEWATVVALAETKKVDVWVLVPLGQAIIRLLTKQAPPPAWAKALTRFFGDDGWKAYFYTEKQTETLFGPSDSTEREVDFAKITEYVVNKLETVFAGVLKTPIVLRNSRGVPLYLLCFGVSNERAVGPALGIAGHIARKWNDGGK